ncbi:MAG: retron system putative HNH endonuclease [Sulfuricurvum sp.]
MKHIVKGSEPQRFTDWKASPKNNTFKKLKGNVKRDVKNALIAEQGGICCYCEVKLEYDDSHIEHLNPQCQSLEGQLDFANMLCSCQQNLKKGEPRHCGNSKGDELISITPLQSDCETKFTYTADGYIGFTDKASQETIKHLQLGIDKLNNLRENAIEPFIIDPITFDPISQEDARIFAEAYLQPREGCFNEFYTTVKYLFMQ